MESEAKNINEKLAQLARDITIIKKMLLEQKEEHLTDWAKEELEAARKRPEKEYVSLEDVKKRALSKK